MKHDDFFLRHMIDAIGEIQDFLGEMTYEQLINDPRCCSIVNDQIETLSAHG